MATPEELQRAHNEGQRDESQGINKDPCSAIARSFYMDNDERAAYHAGRDSVSEQREESSEGSSNSGK